METKEYVEILKSVLKMQIDYIIERDDYDFNEYLQGQEMGLRIALAKIEESKFLFED